MSCSKLLREFLLRAFTLNELRMLIVDEYPALDPTINWNAGGMAQAAFNVVEALKRNGQIDGRFFDLLASQRPLRADEISGLRAACSDSERPNPPPFTQHLTQTDVHALVQLHVDLGHTDPMSWEALKAGIDPALLRSLPASGGTATAYLLTVIGTLNQTQRLRSGQVPLRVWLNNAILLAEARPEARKLEDLLARVEGGPPAPPAASAPPPVPEEQLASLQVEAIVTGSDDTLGVSFLRGGVAAARATAKVLVPRIYDGKPATVRDGEPFMEQGTGWLIGPDLLMTSHHVVAARDTGLPSSEDLRAQVAATEVLFDDYGPDAPPTSRSAKELAAGDPMLDFAILRLAPSPNDERAPLRIRTTDYLHPATQKLRFRVNVLQHPEGRPMRVGFRENFVYDGTVEWLRYLTDTRGGSSGAAVCDDEWRVAALHTGHRALSTGVLTLRGTEVRALNYGRPLGAIMAWLEVNAPIVHAEIRTGQGTLRT